VGWDRGGGRVHLKGENAVAVSGLGHGKLFGGSMWVISYHVP